MNPPPAAFRLLAFVARTPDYPFLEADLREEHAIRAESRGRRRADFWLWRQILASLPRFAFQHFRWSLIMMKNALIVAWRHMRRHKGFSALNILGLAGGLACCLLIGSWILDETSYDRFHENAASICRVESDSGYAGRVLHINWTPHPLGPALESEIPEIVGSARAWNQRNPLIRYGEASTDAWTVWAVDPSFLDMFTFPLLKGDSARALEGTTSVVLTERAARAIFGSEDPVGKPLEITDGGTFAVSGVLADIPRNSSLQFDVLIPYKTLENAGRVSDVFNDNRTTTFVRLADGISVDAAGSKIRDFIRTKIPESGMKLDLLGLTRIHLHTWSGYEKRTAVQSLRLFALIAAFVLLIGCINFMNLSTARAARRAKEIGLRRTAGAGRGHIIRQFYGEAALYSFLALILALAAVTLSYPAFNALTGKEMGWGSLGAGRMALGALAVALVTALIAGSYPALVLSSFRPVQAIRGTLSRGRGGTLFRRILVVVQFALSAGLLVGTGVVARQMAFIQNTPLGWSREQVLAVKIPTEARPTVDALKAEMSSIPGILTAGLSDQSPANTTWSSSGFGWEGLEPETKINVTYTTADEGYVEALGIKVVEGRNFSADIATDRTDAVLVNEALARIIGPGSVVGKRFDFWDQKGTIVGVLGDFHFQPLRNKIEPLVVHWLDSDWIRVMVLRLGP
ncbi:MAG: ABC transporter permease, partial [Candidatus Aminicenantes bacterium]|nr:ABC transporter permease [Candidatus Aminicenantes bacterium]